jgi:histone demethylase JARID1
VRIPRDAARPKLEDLQSWQDEIPNLPFQPDEEQVLDNIINNAQEFRTHVAPFCNPIMATSEEAEIQRFYLRKIEGAEILLAYETNYFKQELHKWSPVAPEPPPVLENSKSTRKPRPTKLQKLMAQHGVDDPENLPQALRTKQHSFKRKSSEPQSGRPPTLQPAPGRSDSGTPTQHSFPPGGPLHHGPVLSGVPPYEQHFSHDNRYFMPSSSANSTPFAPHAYMRGAASLASPSHGSGSPRDRDRDPTIFTGAALARNDPVVGLGGSPGMDSPMRDAFGASVGGGMGINSQSVLGGHQPSFDKMFNELTNQEDESSQLSEKKDGEGKEKTKGEEPESEFLKQVDYEVEWGGDESRMDED